VTRPDEEEKKRKHNKNMTSVFKFGGTCMRHDIDNVIQRIQENADQKRPVIVVVSAFAGATDLLIKGQVEEAISLYGDNVDRDLCTQMHDIMRNFGPSDFLTSYGEKLSAKLLADMLGAVALWADDGIVMVNNKGELSCNVKRFGNHYIEIVTGFCAKHTSDGRTVLLGRDGSDTTATILAQAFKCHCTIFTDVNGIYNIDPRLYADATLLEEITLAEARELAFHGASVLHSRCLDFVGDKGLTVRNVNGAQSRGTLVHPTHSMRTSSKSQFPWTGVAVLRKRVGISIRSASHINKPGFAADTFERFRNVSIDMVAQSCSQTTITLILKEEHAREVCTSDEIPVDRLAIITIVGENMVRTPGVAAELFRRISTINVVSISQGASELSISVAVSESNLGHAIHSLMA